jgi:hypothetical protein
MSDKYNDIIRLSEIYLKTARHKEFQNTKRSESSYMIICSNCFYIDYRKRVTQPKYRCQKCKNTVSMSDAVNFTVIVYNSVYSGYMYAKYNSNPKNKNKRAKLVGPSFTLLEIGSWILVAVASGVFKEVGKDLYLAFKDWLADKDIELSEEEKQQIFDYLREKKRDYLTKNPKVFSKSSTIRKGKSKFKVTSTKKEEII